MVPRSEQEYKPGHMLLGTSRTNLLISIRLHSLGRSIHLINNVMSILNPDVNRTSQLCAPPVDTKRN